MYPKLPSQGAKEARLAAALDPPCGIGRQALEYCNFLSSSTAPIGFLPVSLGKGVTEEPIRAYRI